MPVQINEVIVKAVVDNNITASCGSSTADVASAGSNTTEAEIAALVLEIIKEKNER
jgi:hypothetical protein